MIDFLQLAAQSKPAGGAAIGEVVGATAAALIATAALFYLGMTHRSGRSTLLKRIADWNARVSGFPSWAALPVSIASASLLVAVFGMYWDISLHIDQGRDSGPLANPAHYFILVGLFGIFAAGFLSMVLPEEKPSPSAVRITRDWYAPVGGVVLMACSAFALLGFPLDDVWHRLFGQDVTLWGPTHLMMIGGAGVALLGNATLMVEAGRHAGPRSDGGGDFVRRLYAFRYAAVFGGLLIGLSTFQAEFDFGVPQFQLIFQPVLIAFAAGVALVGGRIYSGPGGALIAAGFFIAVHGILALLVGPVLGETTPHFPLYLAEAAIVELVALRVSTREPYKFGATCGVLIGTVGLAAEWAWSHIWMPNPWPSSLLLEAATLVPLAGLAAGAIGGFVGTALVAPRRRKALKAPSVKPAAAGLLLIAILIGYGLATTEGDKATATARVSEAGPGKVNATVTLDPPSAADDAKWFQITAWQGGDKLVVDHLEKVGDGTWQTSEPIPVTGNWKAILRLHKGNSLEGVPVYMPEDPEIPAKGVPASASFERSLGNERTLLQRERKSDIPSWLYTAASIVVGLIALILISLLGWALARVAAAAAPPSEPPASPSAPSERFERRTPMPAGSA